jgi:hypothetical protein
VWGFNLLINSFLQAILAQVGSAIPTAGDRLIFLPVEVDKQQHGGDHNKPVGLTKADRDHLVDSNN